MDTMTEVREALNAVCVALGRPPRDREGGEAQELTWIMGHVRDRIPPDIAARADAALLALKQAGQ